MNRTYDAASAFSFLIGQLSYVEQKLYEVKYKDITYDKVIPLTNEAGEWATSITYFFMNGTAIAEFVGTKSLNVPIAEIGTDKVEIPVELGATGYEYSDEEIRQAEHLNRPLPQLKANAARRAYEELVQKTSMFGDTVHGLPGFLNNSNVTTVTVAATGTGSATTWVSKTPTQILFDINSFMGSIYVDTLQVERPTRLLIPTAQWNYITTTARSEHSDMTIMKYLVANSPYLSSEADIMSLPELKGIGAGSTDMMVAYDMTIDKVVLHIPMPLRFTEPQRKGRGFEIPGEFKVGGVEFRYPASARYGIGI